MVCTAALASLSPAGRGLVKLMQGMEFGRIEGLVIQDGQPVLHPMPRIIREIKFGGENGAHSKAGTEDFALKSQVCELFDQISKLGNGTILSLEVKHGLPFRMTLAEEAA